MPRDEERARDDFTGEAEELLDALSRDLAQFEAQGVNVRPELINKVFRDVHSLKGLAGMVGFTEISELAHTLEDMLDRLRMGRVAIGKQLMDLLYDSVDSLNRLVIAVRDPDVRGLVDIPALTLRIHQIVQAGPQQKPSDALREINLDEQTRKSLTEYEEHRLIENIRAGKQILCVEARFDFSDFDHKLRALAARLTESGEVLSTLPSVDPSGSGIGFRLLYGTALDLAAVSTIAPEAKVSSLRTVLHEEEEVSLRSVSATVRVDIGKLDAVMNTIGELLIERNQLDALTRALSKREAQELTKISRNLNRKLNELQKLAIELRMVPVGQIYSKVSRSVRKLARELNKNIELILHGEETELDKMLVEEISDPLMHIIRNALDHGIEPAQERIAAGKEAKGHVSLTAYQQGNSVVIDVSDDGRGIDPEVIRKAAAKNGLEATADPYDLLFTPGFSTAAEVSEISGRGVGLDVVKKNIQELKGSIDVISTVGQGTTFRIMLPITLAIIQALIVRAADQQFAIPLTSVEESLRIQMREIRTVEAREVLALRDMTLPLVRLADAFSLDTEDDSPDAKLFVVVTRSGEKLAGVMVNAIVRQQEIVLKSIGERLKSTPGIAGATEIGEGEIVLVIDVGSLMEHFGGRAREVRASAHV
ncbi:MAG TPA: chemotaxis protein CheA [Thermoanaerobaculia bacterium]|nr:chemotaxis protein CheA [Thermoanaerobaculia bacterium]